jgi:hypothetical protein
MTAIPKSQLFVFFRNGFVTNAGRKLTIYDIPSFAKEGTF